MELMIPVLIVAVVGLIAGLGLAVASKVMAVPVDEKTERLEHALPGVNCGACGFSGCSGYANALSKGETENVGLCAPGGDATAKELAEITGLKPQHLIPVAAAVLCQGNQANAKVKLSYVGVKSCKMANQLFGGPKECIYGCVGYGDCAAVCPYDAIQICDGIARINPMLCRACAMCVKECPKNIIAMLPLNVAKAAVLCINQDKGAKTRTMCTTGCIGCMRCKKNCEFDAITIEDFCAKVDYMKCNGCGKCHEVCPVKCIDLIELRSLAAKEG